MTTSADESALLAAIAADLGDDTVRLAYADWLDEHGENAPCSQCEGKGRFVDDLGSDGMPVDPSPCSTCKSTGVINSRRDRALPRSWRFVMRRVFALPFLILAIGLLAMSDGKAVAQKKLPPPTHGLGFNFTGVDYLPDGKFKVWGYGWAFGESGKPYYVEMACGSNNVAWFSMLAGPSFDWAHYESPSPYDGSTFGFYFEDTFEYNSIIGQHMLVNGFTGMQLKLYQGTIEDGRPISKFVDDAYTLAYLDW